jgi:aryl-alcohol dehydrogenase-like predicted oxidoreductase
MMEYRRLGKSGLEVSVIGLGTLMFGERCDANESAAIVNAALDAGVNFIDTADIYGERRADSVAVGIGQAEEYLGRALRGRRHEAIIATKGSIRISDGRARPDASRRYLIEAAEASLRRLETDYIDLYQIHMPDPKTPIEETLHTLDDLVRSGKVRYVACVNHSAWQLADAAWTAQTHHLTPFISSQNRYNLIEHATNPDIFAACERFGLGFIPFLPLAGGLLTGKYRRDGSRPEGARLSADNRRAQQVSLSARNLQLVDRLDAVATERGHTLLELALSWLIALPLIGTVITGATTPEQVQQNVAAGSWKLTADDMAAVNAAVTDPA